MAAEAIRDSSVHSGLGPLTPGEDGDMTLSDDSLTRTPPAAQPPTKKNLKRVDDRRARDGSRKRMATSAPRGTGGAAPRGMTRPPSPCLEALPRGMTHELCTPAANTPEARLEALERQQKVDHLFLNTVKSTLGDLHKFTEHSDVKLKNLKQSLDEHTQIGVQLRRELYSVRDNLSKDVNQVATAVTSEVPKVIEQQLATAQAKVEMIDGQVKVLQQHTSEVAEHGAKMGTYLEHLHGERPREGQTVVDAFNQINNEVGRVKDVVNQLEHKQPQLNVPTVFQGEVLTKEMLAVLDGMHRKIAGMDQVYNSYNVMYGRVAKNTAMAEALSTSCAEFVQRILTLEENAPSLSPASAAPIAQPCGARLNAACPHAWNPGSACPCPHAPPGMPGSSGGPTDTRMQAIVGGNGVCHCIRVKELQDRMGRLEGPNGRGPWHGAGGGTGP